MNFAGRHIEMKTQKNRELPFFVVIVVRRTYAQKGKTGVHLPRFVKVKAITVVAPPPARTAYPTICVQIPRFALE